MLISNYYGRTHHLKASRIMHKELKLILINRVDDSNSSYLTLIYNNSLQEFVNSPCMTEIRERSCFLHVDVPGHADHAEALPESFQFPPLKTLGEDLVTVLDFLHVKYVIGLGEGAGANVLARFGLAHPTRALGLILINATGSAASVMQSFKSKLIQWKSDEVAQSAESFLMYHKFGHPPLKIVPTYSSEKCALEIPQELSTMVDMKDTPEGDCGLPTFMNCGRMQHLHLDIDTKVSRREMLNAVTNMFPIAKYRDFQDLALS
uniref:AB hydrolase-1 domain-containing protein n=1 Tax=Glossina pallidipes TaxID=7398 RepID=A0A1A9Z6Z5_GLOPL